MSDSKVYMFPDSGNFSGGSSSIDPNLLLALNNGGGGFGGNCNWMWIFFLWFLYPFFQRNGFGQGGDGSGFPAFASQFNSDAGRELLMQAINRNGDAVDNLASMFNTTSGNIMQAINGLVFNRWYADMCRTGQPIEWSDVL